MPPAISITPSSVAITGSLEPVNGSGWPALVPVTPRFPEADLFPPLGLLGVVGGVNGAVVVDGVDVSVVVDGVVGGGAGVVVDGVVACVVMAQSSFPGLPSFPAPPGDPFEHRGPGGFDVVVVCVVVVSPVVVSDVVVVSVVVVSDVVVSDVVVTVVQSRPCPPACEHCGCVHGFRALHGGAVVVGELGEVLAIVEDAPKPAAPITAKHTKSFKLFTLGPRVGDRGPQSLAA